MGIKWHRVVKSTNLLKYSSLEHFNLKYHIFIVNCILYNSIKQATIHSSFNPHLSFMFNKIIDENNHSYSNPAGNVYLS